MALLKTGFGELIFGVLVGGLHPLALNVHHLRETQEEDPTYDSPVDIMPIKCLIRECLTKSGIMTCKIAQRPIAGRKLGMTPSV